MDLTMLGYCVYKFNKLLRETGSTTPLQLRKPTVDLVYYLVDEINRGFPTMENERVENFLRLENILII